MISFRRFYECHVKQFKVYQKPSVVKLNVNGISTFLFRETEAELKQTTVSAKTYCSKSEIHVPAVHFNCHTYSEH